MTPEDKPRTPTKAEKEIAGENRRTRSQALLNMHKMFLEALRHREQDIVHFLAILGPALGGFIWLLGKTPSNPAMFVAGTYGVLFVLVTGAFYSLALGYNYRYLTLQLAKLEADKTLGLGKIVLNSWPRSPEAFKRRNRWGVIPWSTPPDIIKVFWIAFLAGILGVTITVSCVDIGPQPLTEGVITTQPTSSPAEGEAATAREDVRQQALHEAERVEPLTHALPWVGGLCFALGLLWPVTVGRKMLNACKNEDFEPKTKNEEPKRRTRNSRKRL